MLSSLAWIGLVYTLWRFSYHAELGTWRPTVVPANVFSLVSFFCALAALLCTIPQLRDGFADRSTWALAVWCFLPFITIATLLYPLFAHI